MDKGCEARCLRRRQMLTGGRSQRTWTPVNETRLGEWVRDTLTHIKRKTWKHFVFVVHMQHLLMWTVLQISEDLLLRTGYFWKSLDTHQSPFRQTGYKWRQFSVATFYFLLSLESGAGLKESLRLVNICSMVLHQSWCVEPGVHSRI